MTQRVHQLAVHFSNSPMTQWQNIALEAGSTWIPRHPSSHIDLLQHKRTQKVSLSKRKWKYFKGGLQMTLPRGSITHALLVALLSVGGSGNARIALMLGRAVISMARSEEELYLKAFRSLSGEIDAGRLWESKRWHWPTLFGHTARQGRQQGKRRSRREERGKEKGQFPSSFSPSLSLSRSSQNARRRLASLPEVEKSEVSRLVLLLPPLFSSFPTPRSYRAGESFYAN